MTNDLFTIDSTLTLGGAVSIVFIVCNGCQKAFNFNPKWLALIVSVIIAELGVMHNPKSEFLNYLIGVLNGFLIFCTGAGATQAAGKPLAKTTPKTFGQAANTNKKRNFLTSWFA